MVVHSAYDIVIGLEVHVQLLTQSKLFCRCSTRFGAEPNTQTCPVCIGMPGSLPVMNAEAYELSLQTALALNCEIPEFTKWDRKQYYYPDLPKGYQISQYDLPMSEHGWLEISDSKERFQTKRVGITRAHLEEDAGKSMHDEAAGKADSLVDLNRTGTPLLEIVSEPDMRSALEARAYLTELKLLLTYLGVSDCNMEQGSLRVDANINLHVHDGDEKIPTPIVEIKNMNSFRAVERALDYEAERQWRLWQKEKKRLGDVPKQTRGWLDKQQKTKGQRSKEESSDYRYFPDPDLVPVITSRERVEQVRADLGVLPAALRSQLVEKYDIPSYDADVIVSGGREIADYYVAVAEGCGDGKQAANWVTQSVFSALKDHELSIAEFPLSAEQLTDLLSTIQSGDLDNSRAREVFDHMLTSGQSVQSTMQELGIEKVDESELENLCRELLQANPRVVADIQAGKSKAVGALIGQARQRNPNADPAKVRELCLKLAEGMSAE